MNLLERFRKWRKRRAENLDVGPIIERKNYASRSNSDDSHETEHIFKNREVKSSVLALPRAPAPALVPQENAYFTTPYLSAIARTQFWIPGTEPSKRLAEEYRSKESGEWAQLYYKNIERRIRTLDIGVVENIDRPLPKPLGLALEILQMVAGYLNAVYLTCLRAVNRQFRYEVIGHAERKIGERVKYEVLSHDVRNVRVWDRRANGPVVMPRSYAKYEQWCVMCRFERDIDLSQAALLACCGCMVKHPRENFEWPSLLWKNWSSNPETRICRGRAELGLHLGQLYLTCDGHSQALWLAVR